MACFTGNCFIKKIRPALTSSAPKAPGTESGPFEPQFPVHMHAVTKYGHGVTHGEAAQRKYLGLNGLFIIRRDWDACEVGGVIR